MKIFDSVERFKERNHTIARSNLARKLNKKTNKITAEPSRKSNIMKKILNKK